MSFLLDPPLLYASGEALARVAPERRDLAAGVVGLFWAVSIPLYLHERTRGFMINSWLLDIRREPHPLLVAAIFASYPLFLLAGLRRGRR